MREPEMVASSNASASTSLNCFIKSGPLVPDTYAVDIRILPIFSSWDAAAAKKGLCPGQPGKKSDRRAGRDCEHGMDRGSSDPRLNAEPTTGNNGAQNCGQVSSAHAERRTNKNREGRSEE